MEGGKACWGGFEDGAVEGGVKDADIYECEGEECQGGLSIVWSLVFLRELHSMAWGCWTRRPGLAFVLY